MNYISDKKLRVLMILHMPWDKNLGGPRAQMEITDALQRAGHFVEKFDLYDAFPEKETSFIARFKIQDFSERAAQYVRQNAHKFDIIDAHQGNLPYSKESLGFKGLLVNRSVGLYAFYEDFAAKYPLDTNVKGVKIRLRNLLKFLINFGVRENIANKCLLGFHYCDLINVCNSDEYTYLRDHLGLGSKTITIPLGISAHQVDASAYTAQSAEFRLLNKTIVFIGYWSSRKGSRDWPQIINQVKSQVPEAKFLFLGTGVSEADILQDLRLEKCNWIKIIPEFSNKDIPKLLSNATVGAFPSYIEGFGIAVLEKLASGLPTVAYDVPGPREMLGKISYPLMVTTGDTEGFSNSLVRLLSMDQNTYQTLSNECKQIARKFTWESIADKTLEVYQQSLLFTNNKIY